MKNMFSFQIGVHLSVKYFVNTATRLILQLDARYAPAMILQVNVPLDVRVLTITNLN